jgi:N-acetylglutamate synthase
MDAKIREMYPGDYKAVRALWEKTPGVGTGPGDSPKEIAAYLKRNPGLSAVAELNGKIVGTILCGHDGRRGWIHHLAVDVSRRRLGIGTALVKYSIDGLEKAGLKKCNIVVFQDNATGLAFWESTGWKNRKDLAFLQKIMGGKTRRKNVRKPVKGCC